MSKYHFSDKEVEQCSVFGEKIAWKHPHFADNRNDAKRSVWQIKFDVMRGKMAEIAVYKHILSELPDADMKPLDFNVYPKGVADQGDIICNGHNISIKSSKPIASCLLIETQRFQMKDGLPFSIDNQALPDFFIFVKVDEKSNEATICGMVSFEEFWNNRTFLPRGMMINYSNAKKAMIEKISPTQLPTDKGVPLLADNYGLHLEQLNPFNPNLFHKDLLKNA